MTYDLKRVESLLQCVGAGHCFAHRACTTTTHRSLASGNNSLLIRCSSSSAAEETSDSQSMGCGVARDTPPDEGLKLLQCRHSLYELGYAKTKGFRFIVPAPNNMDPFKGARSLHSDGPKSPSFFDPLDVQIARSY